MCLATNNIRTNPSLILTTSSLEELSTATTIDATVPLTPKNILLGDKAEAGRRRKLLFSFHGIDNGRSSCCSLTEDETSASTETDTETEVETEEEEEIQLITRPRSRRRTSAPLLRPQHHQVFADQLHEASIDPSQTTLILQDFIERSTRHDIYALRDLLLQDDNRHWKTVRFEDRCPTVGFRRWTYKKDNIQHHIQKVCLDHQIPLEFHSRMEVNVDDDTNVPAMLLLLKEIKKHPEIRQLDIVGHMNLQQEETLLKEVTSLLRLNDRDWDAVNIHTGFVAKASSDCEAAAEEKEYEAWRQLMVHYMGTVFSQLYTKYNIPIDIRPCSD